MKFLAGDRVTHGADPYYTTREAPSERGFDSVVPVAVPVFGTVIRQFGPGYGRGVRVHVSWPASARRMDPWWHGEHIPSALKCVTNK